MIEEQDATPAFTVIETLQDNDNFLVQKVSFNDRTCIYKSVKSTAPEHRINRFKFEKEWGEHAKRLTQDGKLPHIYIPEFFWGNDKEFIREFIDAPSMCADQPGVSLGEANIKLIAQALLELDGIALNKVSAEAVHSNESVPYFNISLNLDRWKETPIKAGLITEDDIVKAKQIITQNQTYLQPAFQHGDFVPYTHVLRMPSDNKVGLIDFEHGSFVKPRYYDLCYATSRIYTKLQNALDAGALLRRYTQSQENDENFWPAVEAIMTQRAVGVCFDAINDYKKGDDYRSKARQLLDYCLAGKTKELING